MPDKSFSKVRVTRLYGTDSNVGLVSPAINMFARYGTEDRWIVSLDSGNFQVGLSLSSGGATIAKAYPHDLVIDTTQASGFGWPSGTEAVTFGHADVFPNGVPFNLGSGMYYHKENGGELEFSRRP